LQNRPTVLVGKTVTVRHSEVEPSYFTDVHRSRVGGAGVVHAVVPAQPRDNPLIKVKFGPDDQIVFFRLSELDVRHDEPAETPQQHGKRASHLPQAE
jgi:hypothetical protein